MEEILVSVQRLCQMVYDANLRPGTEERLRMVLAAGATESLFNASFIPWLKEAVVGFLDRFTLVTKLADDLAARLQPMRPASALPVALAGLAGDNLFRALVALRLPATATKHMHLEVALSAQRLAQQDTIDQITHIYEEIIFEGNNGAMEDARMMAFLRRRLTLDSIVKKHVDLAAGAAN